MKVIKSIFLLFVLSLPFTSAFAFHAIASGPVILSLLVIFIYLLGVIFQRFSWFRHNSLPLFLFFAGIFFSFLINVGNEKSINHLLLYVLTVFVLYFGIRNTTISIVKKDKSFFNTILKCLTVTVFVASAFAIIEFLCMNILHININSVIPRGSVLEYEPLSLNYIRARSFIEESGHFAFFLECLAPLSIYYIFKNREKLLYKWVYLITVIIALLVTFSSFGFVMLFASVAIFMYFYFKYFDKIKNGLVKVAIIAGCFIVVFIVFKDIVDLIGKVITTKMIGSENYGGRMSHAEESMSFFNNENVIFGYGPASYNTLNKGSYFSFFYTVLLDSGIAGLFCLIWFLLKQAVYIFKIKDKPFQCCCIISFVTATTHYIYIGNYYYPWYWLFLSIMYVFYLVERKAL